MMFFDTSIKTINSLFYNLQSTPYWDQYVIILRSKFEDHNIHDLDIKC